MNHGLKMFVAMLASALLLTACGEAGQSRSGAVDGSLGKSRLMLECERQGDRAVNVGDDLVAQFRLSAPYNGEAQVVTLCDLEINSVQQQVISGLRLDVSTTLPEHCGGLKNLYDRTNHANINGDV